MRAPGHPRRASSEAGAAAAGRWPPGSPSAEIEAFKERIGWTMPWFSTMDSFNADFDVTTGFGLNVFIRDGSDIYRTYFTTGRGVETLGTIWTLLDLTPLGRQESQSLASSPGSPNRRSPSSPPRPAPRRAAGPLAIPRRRGPGRRWRAARARRLPGRVPGPRRAAGPLPCPGIIGGFARSNFRTLRGPIHGFGAARIRTSIFATTFLGYATRYRALMRRATRAHRARRMERAQTLSSTWARPCCSARRRRNRHRSRGASRMR